MLTRQPTILSPYANLTDKELQKYEQLILPADSDINKFIPSMPVSVITEIVHHNAVAILPLVMAIHRQMIMRRNNDTPLNEAIWSIAGNPSSKQRENILRKLKSLPHIFELRAERTRIYHYRVKRGNFWSTNAKLA
jgi:hypothetical protein